MEKKYPVYYIIFSLSPTENGDEYRKVESFDNEADAKHVLKALEEVNVLCNCYIIKKYNTIPNTIMQSLSGALPDPIMVLQEDYDYNGKL